MKEQTGGSRDAGERREQMLRAALDVILERGYADTRIADVAERTGTSPALVIYYLDRKSTRLNSSHLVISYAVFCLKKKMNNQISMHSLPRAAPRTLNV